MPKSNDFAKLKKLVIQHGENTIKAFAKTPQNKGVYVFVIDSHALYGDVNFRWNTLDGFAYTRTFDSYKDYTDDRLYGHIGLKYCVGDFRFEDERNEKLGKWTMNYADALDELCDEEEEEDQVDQYMDTFIAVLIEAMKELMPALSQLDLTDNFIAYVVDHDAADMTYLPETVSPSQLDKAFPELKAYETYKTRLQSLQLDEQAAFWCQTLADFEDGQESEAVIQLRSLSRYSFDVQDELVKLGEIAVPFLVTYLEKEFEEQFALQDNGHSMKAWTFQSPIIDIAKAGENEIGRLQALYLRQKQERPEAQNTTNTWRVLHALDPLRFPE
ncbi:DUF4303 domain-containing protein [Cohnella sp. GbtcB17]|uniref:DUF4303 domain-containing protein n=1 Tax=Cohnella sp. GbtcB17 TaxID=2824762 RepID=UPI001C2FC395|nr:DUF4303 domain-containing protein [Cohnella sp. GbtcB17]